MTFPDQLGRIIEVDYPPRRIVSLVPSQTELLYDLGLTDQVVGITKFCIHPEGWFRTKRRVGGTKHVNLEEVAALHPDLIIGNKEENTKADIEALAKQYPVWLSDILTLDNALEMVRRVGELVDRKENAARLASQLKEQFQSLSDEIAPLPRLRTAYFIWRNPYMVAAAGTFIHDMLARAGFDNVFEDQERYPEITLAELQNLNPEVLLLSSEPYPFKEKHLEELREVLPEAKVRLVDGGLFSWYGSRLLRSSTYFRNLRDILE